MLTALGFFFSIFLIIAPSVFAAENFVFLNEIYSPTSNDDWVEIYNNSSQQVDVGGWKLVDSTGTMTALSSEKFVPPYGFLVVPVSNRLNNGGDSVNLVDLDGSSLDSFSYTSSQVGKSSSRVPDGTGGWSAETDVTKGSANSTSPPDSNPPPSNTTPPENNNNQTQNGKIVLVEFMPNPSSGDEWAKVRNPNGFSMDISGWKIDDQEGGSSAFAIPKTTNIGPNQSEVFYFSSRLNNTNDSIRLLSPSGTVIESFTYTQTVKGVSFVKDKNGNWVLSNSSSSNTSSTSTTKRSSNADPNTSAQGNQSVDISSVNPVLGTSTPSNKLGNDKNAINSTERGNGLPPISIVLIAAGISALIVAPLWPFIEKRFLKKRSGR